MSFVDLLSHPNQRCPERVLEGEGSGGEDEVDHQTHAPGPHLPVPSPLWASIYNFLLPGACPAC